MPDLPSAIIYYVVFLFSTTLHEAAHAWAAKLGGDLTAYHGGQVSLDPRPHIRREPFGMVVLPLISVLISGWPFGYASAPYDPHWAVRHPRRAAWMALAGPGANLLLALMAATAIRVGMATGVFVAPEAVRFGHLVGTDAAQGGPWTGAALAAGVVFSLNVTLATFNLIPLPPLDGSSAVPLLLNDDATTRYQRFVLGQPALQVIGMLLAWRLYALVFQPIFLISVNLLYPGLHYR